MSDIHELKHAGDSVDTPSMSAAVSQTSLVDDIPKTPKKGSSSSGGTSLPPHCFEILVTAVGSIAIIGICYFVYKRFSK